MIKTTAAILLLALALVVWWWQADQQPPNSTPATPRDAGAEHSTVLPEKEGYRREVADIRRGHSEKTEGAFLNVGNPTLDADDAHFVSTNDETVDVGPRLDADNPQFVKGTIKVDNVGHDIPLYPGYQHRNDPVIDVGPNLNAGDGSYRVTSDQPNLIGQPDFQP